MTWSQNYDPLGTLALSAVVAAVPVAVLLGLLAFWHVPQFAALAGWRGMVAVWPASLLTGLSFAVMQFLVSNFHGPWLVDLVAAVAAMLSLVVLMRFWKPKAAAEPDAEAGETASPGAWNASLPRVFLTGFVFLWSLPEVKGFLNGVFLREIEVPALHLGVEKVPPAALRPEPEKAIFRLNPLAATGTAALLAGVLAGLCLGLPLRRIAAVYTTTIVRLRVPLLTISLMLALGYVSRYSDTSSNVLFGNLQQVKANQLGLSPVHMAASNSSGGVMGKMIDAQSIVVATGGRTDSPDAGTVLRSVFWHSIALALLMGLLVLAQSYWMPWVVPGAAL